VCRAKGGIGSGETLCHDIYPARSITTVSLAANTYCTLHRGPKVQFSGACEHSMINDRPAHTTGGHLLPVVQAATNTERI